MLSALLDQLHAQAEACGHRRCLVLGGDPAWIRAQLLAVERRAHWCWVGDGAIDGIERQVPMRQAAGLLGQDNSVVVFDAYSGFHPDAFGAVSGTVRGGGVLILLAPPLDQWPDYADPDGLRYVASPAQLPRMGRRFLGRLATLLLSDPATTCFEQGQPWPTLPVITSVPAPARQLADPDCATEDQLEAVKAVIKTVTGHRRRPLVLSADRGRGKSSALGIASGRLMAQRPRHILVTAPSPKAVAAVLAHAERVLANTGEPARRQGHALYWQDSSLAFVAPDELLRTRPVCDLLLVDEAAAIPTPLLSGMLKHYARLVYATTLHGYEGTGRGFALRFQQILARECPQWRRLHLKAAIRWRDNDPLEALVFKSLGLDAEAAELPAALPTPADCQYRRLSQDELAARPEWLGQLFGLLVLAHYQTTPSDFRQLLDAPDLVIFAGFHRQRIVATALVSLEGALPTELHHGIWAGDRRLRGHLMPQSLMAQAGFVEAGALRYGRIMRIAVHPGLHRSGVGRALYQYIEAWASDAGLDGIGASFGATADLLRFWHNMGCRLLRLGISRDTASGCHSALVMQPMSDAGRGLVEAAEQRFYQQLPGLLARALGWLEPDKVVTLLAQAPMALPLSPADRRDAAAFGWGRRPLELALPALQQLVWHLPSRLAALTKAEQALIVAVVLQGRDWQAAAQLVGVAGRKAAEIALRRALTQLAPELKSTFGDPAAD